MRLLIFVEGDTEYRCLRLFLDKWFYSQGLQTPEIDIVDLGGCGGFIGKSHDEFKIVSRARAHLDSPKGNDIFAAIGLQDLADLTNQSFFPNEVVGVAERYTWGVRKLESCVNRSKFHMYFSVHEFEAWLFSQPEIFSQDVRGNLFNGLPEPEEINFNRPPSKRLKRCWKNIRRKKYKKTTDGQMFFSALDPQVAHDKCPYLAKMLDHLVELAIEEGLQRIDPPGQ